MPSLDDGPIDVATTILDGGTEPRAADGAPNRLGRTLGRYVIMGKVGEGGMGQVLRAYDPKLGREVAIKIVMPSRMGPDAAARLVTEARAMARISHPNVVSVFDVEELEKGRLALVMEYVAGTDLKSWLAAAPRDWVDVVGLFVRAGRGLVAAHNADLLHRDFKPANVLIANDEDGGAVKVTDFGLAKLVADPTMHASLSDHSVQSSGDLTRTGTVMGTPRYMAPEQYNPAWGQTAAQDPNAAAADQYAFCVALWEGIVGEPPFQGASMVGQKIAGPAAWPKDSVVPERVAEAILRGLSPRPRDRWPSMTALLAELTPPKPRRRYKELLGAAAILGVGVAVATPFVESPSVCVDAEQRLHPAWGPKRRQAVDAALRSVNVPYAQSVADQATEELDHYGRQWSEMHAEACESTQRGEQSESSLDLRMRCLHRARVGLGAVVDELESSDREVLRRAKSMVDALPPVEQCADMERLEAEVSPPPAVEQEAVATARRHIARAEARREAGRYEDAQQSIEQARATLSEVSYRPVAAELALEFGYLLDAIGKYARSEKQLLTAMKLAGASGLTREMASASRLLMFSVGSNQRRMRVGLRYLPLARGLSEGDAGRGSVHNNYGTVLHAMGRNADAEAQHRMALQLQTRAYGLEHQVVAQSHDNLAIALEDQGKLEEAEVQYQSALRIRLAVLGPQHPTVGNSYQNMAGLFAEQGDYERAEASARQALELWEPALGSDNPDVSEARQNIGLYLDLQGKHVEGEAQHRLALQVRRATVGDQHADIAIIRNNLAMSLQHQGKIDEAIAEYEKALDLWTSTVGPDHPDVALALNNLANLIAGRDQLPKAERYYSRALAISESTFGPKHRQSCSIRHSLAWLLISSDRWDEAHAIMVRLLALREASVDPDDLKLAATRSDLAYLELLRGNPAQALPLAESAWERRQRDDVDAFTRASAAFDLAQALWVASKDPGARTRARSLAERALQEYRNDEGEHREEEATVKRWLQAHRSGTR